MKNKLFSILNARHGLVCSDSWTCFLFVMLALKEYEGPVVVYVVKSYPTLFWPHGLYSLPGSSVRGISQARILEWLFISFSRGSSWTRDWTHVSCIAGRILYHWATSDAHKRPVHACVLMASKSSFLLKLITRLKDSSSYSD